MAALLRGAGALRGDRGRQALGYGAAGAAGALLGLGAFAAGSAGPRAAVGITLAISAPFALMLVARAQRVLLGLLILDIPLQLDVYLDYQTREGDLGAIAGLNLSVTTFALACLYALWAAEWLGRNPERARPRWRAALPLTAYLALNLISTAVASSPSLSLYYVALLVQLLLVFVYFASTIRTREAVQFVVAMLLVSLALEGLAIGAVRVAGVNLEVLGLSSQTGQGSAPHTLTQAQHASQNSIGPRLGGTLGSPNTAGGFLAMLIPVAASVLAAPFPRWLRRLALVALGGGFVALILTFSRGSWLATAAAIGLLLVIGTRAGLFSPRMLAAAVAVMLLAAAPLYGAVGARLTGDDAGAASSRVPLMKLAGRMIAQRPVLGVGANNFASSIPRFAGPEFSRDWIYTVHNKYLLVAAETGLAALAVFLWFLVATLRRGMHAWRARDDLLSPLALGLTVSIAGQLVAMGVDLFNDRAQLQLLWLMAGLITALGAMTASRRRAPR